MRSDVIAACQTTCGAPCRYASHERKRGGPPLTRRASVHGRDPSHNVQDTGTQVVVETERFPVITTTLFDLIAALQAVVEPEEDAWVVATVVHWLRSSRIRLYDRGYVYPCALIDEP